MSAPIGNRTVRPSVLAALLSTATLAACASLDAGGGEPAALTGPPWRVSHVRGTAILAPQGRQAPTITFSDGRASGFAGCNRFTAPFTATATGALSMGVAVSTRMACITGEDTERQLLAAIRDVARWRVAGDRLDLLDAAGGALVELCRGSACQLSAQAAPANTSPRAPDAGGICTRPRDPQQAQREAVAAHDAATQALDTALARGEACAAAARQHAAPALRRATELFNRYVAVGDLDAPRSNALCSNFAAAIQRIEPQCR